ncbi:MAG: 50S ribosomal protein L10, partial [Candidatus Omnitrophica bacterium]|nr:50S ribosomal protein L10 [Candidatus Omnitrophota bacterium]
METKIKNFGRWCREKIINEMVSTFKGSPTLFVTEFGGLKVVNLETLRTKLRKNYSRLLVVKNSLASKAFKEIKLDFLSE